MTAVATPCKASCASLGVRPAAGSHRARPQWLQPRRSGPGGDPESLSKGRQEIRAAATSGAGGQFVSRPRSADKLGIVILDTGRRTAEGDELLLDWAAAYARAHKRGIVHVANPATLTAAVASCQDEDATKAGTEGALAVRL